MGIYKIIAVDLDGTLLTSAREIAPRSAERLQQASRAGARVIIASARNPGYVREVCQALEINDPIICSNGAQVWGSPVGPVWAHHTIPQEAAQRIAQYADEHNWELVSTVEEITTLRQRPGQALGPVGTGRVVAASNIDGITGDVLRILAWQPEAIEGLPMFCRAQLGGQCQTVIFYKADGTVESLGIFAEKAGKGPALQLVLARLGVQPGCVMAIGDNLVDLPMFAQAGLSVAMGNAPETVKQQAMVVAPGNDEEGVAWAVEQFML
jgi:hypothetical protein